MPSPILLISGQADSGRINELRTNLATPILQVADIRLAVKALKEQTFSLLMLDMRASEDPTKSGLLVEVAGITPVLEIDLTTATISTLLHKIRSMRSRIAAEQVRARNAAIAHLQGELRDSLTGLLLESQLALREVDASRHPKLVNVVRMATQLSARLKLEAEWTSFVG